MITLFSGGSNYEDSLRNKTGFLLVGVNGNSRYAISNLQNVNSMNNGKTTLDDVSNTIRVNDVDNIESVNNMNNVDNIDRNDLGDENNIVN